MQQSASRGTHGARRTRNHGGCVVGAAVRPLVSDFALLAMSVHEFEMVP